MPTSQSATFVNDALDAIPKNAVNIAPIRKNLPHSTGDTSGNRLTAGWNTRSNIQSSKSLITYRFLAGILSFNGLSRLMLWLGSSHRPSSAMLHKAEHLAWYVACSGCKPFARLSRRRVQETTVIAGRSCPRGDAPYSFIADAAVTLQADQGAATPLSQTRLCAAASPNRQRLSRAMKAGVGIGRLAGMAVKASCPNAVAVTYRLEARPQQTVRSMESTRIISPSRLNEWINNKLMAIKLAV